MLLPNTGEKTVATVKQSEVLTVGSQTTTASFADFAGSKIDAGVRTTVAMVIKNTGGANGLSWKVLGSIDDVTYVEAQASRNVAFGASDSYTTNPALYRYYKMQIVDQVGGSHTTATGSVIGK
jgi:hypothetical protein